MPDKKDIKLALTMVAAIVAAGYFLDFASKYSTIIADARKGYSGA